MSEEHPTYTEGQSWGALRKAWTGYRIAKGKNDKAGMEEFEQRIKNLQKQLGLEVGATDFS